MWFAGEVRRWSNINSLPIVAFMSWKPTCSCSCCVIPRASKLFWVFKKRNKESMNCTRSVRNFSNNTLTFSLLHCSVDWYIVCRIRLSCCSVIFLHQWSFQLQVYRHSGIPLRNYWFHLCFMEFPSVDDVSNIWFNVWDWAWVDFQYL